MPTLLHSFIFRLVLGTFIIGGNSYAMLPQPSPSPCLPSLPTQCAVPVAYDNEHILADDFNVYRLSWNCTTRQHSLTPVTKVPRSKLVALNAGYPTALLVDDQTVTTDTTKFMIAANDGSEYIVSGDSITRTNVPLRSFMLNKSSYVTSLARLDRVNEGIQFGTSSGEHHMLRRGDWGASGESTISLLERITTTSPFSKTLSSIYQTPMRPVSVGFVNGYTIEFGLSDGTFSFPRGAQVYSANPGISSPSLSYLSIFYSSDGKAVPRFIGTFKTDRINKQGFVTVSGNSLHYWEAPSTPRGVVLPSSGPSCQANGTAAVVTLPCQLVR